MPGKGQRRREKNYRAAHGAESRLPPPPKPRELEAIPTKLRHLMAFQNKPDAKANADASAGGGGALVKQDDGAGKNKPGKDKKTKKQTLETPAGSKVAENEGDGAPAANENVNEERSKKRKRGKAMDLRFKELDEKAKISKKQRRKKFMDEKKKKRKGKKTEVVSDFPEQDKVKFGEVVEAPPKLSFPKVKSRIDASRELLRKEAIENYRNIKGWTSRPGLQLPALAENTSL